MQITVPSGPFLTSLAKAEPKATALQVIAWGAAVDRKCTPIITVAILAQGTSWAVADTQAFLPSGSITMRVQSQRATACSRSATSVVLPCARELHAASSTPCARNGLEHWVAYLTKHRPRNGLDVVMCCAAVCHAKCMDADCWRESWIGISRSKHMGTWCSGITPA